MPGVSRPGCEVVQSRCQIKGVKPDLPEPGIGQEAGPVHRVRDGPRTRPSAGTESQRPLCRDHGSESAAMACGLRQELNAAPLAHETWSYWKEMLPRWAVVWVPSPSGSIFCPYQYDHLFFRSGDRPAGAGTCATGAEGGSGAARRNHFPGSAAILPEALLIPHRRRAAGPPSLPDPHATLPSCRRPSCDLYYPVPPPIMPPPIMPGPQMPAGGVQLAC